MRKLLLTLAVLCGTVSAWAETPTETFKASTILPSIGIPEYQYYVRGTINNRYWTSTTDDTDDINNAGKFALYAVPGLQDCYYIYSINEGKWLSYPNENRNNQVDFIKTADNFDANAYWKITSSSNGGNACYQMQPTSLDKDYDGETRIKTDRYANWYTGPGACTSIGLWQTGASGDAGSAWSFISVDVADALEVILSQKLAVANEILASQLNYTKGENILTSDNVSTLFSSPYSDSDEGVIANLVDNDAATCWHSNWHAGTKLGGSHYFEINLADITPELLSFSYSRRSAADNDHTVRWAVYGVPADEDGIAQDSRDGLTLLALVSTPWINKNQVFNNLPPFKTQGFKKFRIYSEATEQNRGYFHIGELQLNANTIADSNADKVKELAAAVAEAEALETVTQADIDKLNAKISEFVLSDEDKARAQELLNLTGVGYPAANSAARIALQNVLDNPASSITDLEPAIAAYKTSTDVALPVSGKAYQFAFVANDTEKTEYKVTASGTTLTAATDATASTFYCVEYINVNGEKRFAFISEDGKFLGYHALTDSYITHIDANKRLQNDISFSAMTGVTSNVTSTPEDRFGTVAMKVDNRVLDNQGKNGVFILKWSAGTFDKTDAPFHDRTFTSAIKVTEVAEYTASNAVLTAASTITPLVMGYNRIGEGIGKYSYNYNEGNGTDFNAFETAIKSATDVVESSDYSFEINIPAAGFYYIKSMNANDADKKNKYWQVNEAGAQMELVASKDEKRSIIYASEDYKLVNYGCGYYLNDYDDVSTAGTEGQAWGIVENAQVAGTYALDHPAEEWFLSDWTGGATYGQNDANAAWTFEPVEALPFTFKAAALGFATFNAPVAVELPEGISAYIGELNTGNNTLQMYRLDGNQIPANTAVLLRKEGVTEDETVNFTVVSNVEADFGGVTNSLVGTVAAENLDDTKNCYSLQKSNTTGKVGFYSKTTGTKGGFKAWVETEKTEGARVFTIIFDGEDATGIKEALGLENENVEIYDLSGRRLDKPAKGVNIIGGKTVIVR